MKHEEIIASTTVPLGIIRRVINANVIRHELQKHYELDLSIFFRHYRSYVSDEELITSNNPTNLVRSKWIECVSQFHEEIQKKVKAKHDIR